MIELILEKSKVKVKEQYLTNDKGEKISVIIPIKHWHYIEEFINKTLNKEKHKKELFESIQEVKQIIARKKKGKRIEELLNEL